MTCSAKHLTLSRDILSPTNCQCWFLFTMTTMDPFTLTKKLKDATPDWKMLPRVVLKGNDSICMCCSLKCINPE